MKRFLLILVVLFCSGIAYGQSSQPYSSVYGYNLSSRPNNGSEVTVKAPYNSDVIVIIRYNNQYGKVAGHRYIHSGGQGTIPLNNGMYQVFFYYGSDWSSSKSMGNGVVGGFTRREQFSKDSPVSLVSQGLTYELILQTNGNFNTQGSSKDEVF